MDELEELRRLLLQREREDIRLLRERQEDRGQRTQDVAGVLPHAVQLSHGHGGELQRALQPALENALKESIQKRPETITDAFSPLIGPMIRRSIAESFRSLMQSLNQTLQHTFSIQGLKWRFEALRTGKSFAEIVMLRSLLYRVEQLFLIHHETGLALLHVVAPQATTKDPDMLAGMLSAIQDFARDSFKVKDNASLEEFRIGDLQIWVIPGRYAYLAAAILGTPPRALYRTLEEALESAHILQGAALAKFDGDAAVFESLRPELELCMQPQYQKAPAGEMSLTRAWVALGAAAALAVAAGFFAWRSAGRWDAFIARLKSEPGLAVTSHERHWFSASRISGLRDPLAAQPAELARTSGFELSKTTFDWKEYLALDPVSIRRRFVDRFGLAGEARVAAKDGSIEISGAVPYEWLEQVRREATQVAGVKSVKEFEVHPTYDPALVLQRFAAAYPLPPGVAARVEGSNLVLSGKVPYEWVAQVREGATRLPGIVKLDEKAVELTFDSALVLRRFESRFGVPDNVSATMDDCTLNLAGEASHAWLARVRGAATEIPGINGLDDKKITDLDQTAFQQSKSVIENAFIYFLPNKDNFTTESFTALSRLPDEIRKCETAARRLSLALTIEIQGRADATGLSEKNADLSRRRAEAVNSFLVECGLPAALFKPLAMGAVSAAPQDAPAETKPVGEQAERRVAFRVIPQPISARP